MPHKTIEFKDCSILSTNDTSFSEVKLNERLEAVRFFAEKVQSNIKLYNQNKKEESIDPIISFDYNCRAWRANRYIGECVFSLKTKNNKINTYKICIRPRFGDEVLFKLFEHAYSTIIPESYHEINNQEKNNNSLEISNLYISVYWVHLLKRALRHGLFRVKRTKTESGNTLKGQLLVQKSLLSIYRNNTLQYNVNIKDVNNIPNQILYKAYEILCCKSSVINSLISPSLKTELSSLGQELTYTKTIKYEDYKDIKYDSLYIGYKPLIDLSWQIILSENLNLSNSKNLNTSFFLDVAELWEIFVRNIMIDRLRSEGWNIANNKINIYEGKFYERYIIPDIILTRGDQILVADAKYKNMDGYKKDVDREDIFQIHTYAYYLSHENKQVYSTLIYPVIDDFKIKAARQSTTAKDKIFGKEDEKNLFFIEWIAISNSEQLEESLAEFIESIKSKTKIPQI